jgi:hypothetical protein
MKILYRGLFFLFIIIIFTSYYFINFIQIDEMDAKYYMDPSNEVASFNTLLYFVGSKGLVSEERKLYIQDKFLEMSLVNEMMKGAKDRRLKSIFDYSISLESLDIIEDVYYVNLNINRDGFSILNVENLDLYIWSLVNTITENNTEARVQLFFNGEKLFKEMHGYNLSNPLPRLESLIYYDEISPSDVVMNFINYLTVSRYDQGYNLLSQTSKSEMSYSEFKLLADHLVEEINKYQEILYFTQKYDDYWNIVIKYENNSEVLYKNFKVVEEDNLFKIIFKKNFVTQKK